MKCFLITVLAVSLFACASSRRPSSPSPVTKKDRTSIDAPVPDRAMARRRPGSYAELGLGHAIYMRKCGECHVHKLPDEIKSTDWHIHIPGMAWNAGIEPEEEAALLLYLKAAAKDAETGR